MDWKVLRRLDRVRRSTVAFTLVFTLAGCGVLSPDSGDSEDSNGSGASGENGNGADVGDAQGDAGSDDADSEGAAQYLVYGVVYGPATADCPEGGDVYRDAKRWYAKVVTGSSSDTYEAAADALKQLMMKDMPGQRTYSVESSAVVAGEHMSHVVVIRYSQILSGRYCRPEVITRGYGTSYNSARAQAILSKEANGGKNLSFTELGHMTWTPAPK
jgi:hypothetical protein